MNSQKCDVLWFFFGSISTMCLLHSIDMNQQIHRQKEKAGKKESCANEFCFTLIDIDYNELSKNYDQSLMGRTICTNRIEKMLIVYLTETCQYFAQFIINHLWWRNVLLFLLLFLVPGFISAMNLWTERHESGKKNKATNETTFDVTNEAFDKSLRMLNNVFMQPVACKMLDDSTPVIMFEKERLTCDN